MARKIEYGRMLHGGDYNPEQWLDRPDILKKDIEYFKKAHINTVSVGIFSWADVYKRQGPDTTWYSIWQDFRTSNILFMRQRRSMVQTDGKPSGRSQYRF